MISASEFKTGNYTEVEVADTPENLEAYSPIASHNHTKGNRNMLQPVDLRVNHSLSQEIRILRQIKCLSGISVLPKH